MGNIGRTVLTPLGLSLLALVAGCEDNPLYCDKAADCTDPSRPYCDLTGQYDPDHLGHSCVADPFGAPDAGGGAPDAGGGDPDAGDGDVPTMPVLKRPLANAYVGSVHAAGSRKPIFEWRASTVEGGGTIRYDLRYSTDPTFGTSVTTVDGTTLTSFQPPDDLAGAVVVPVGARYYWRVRACTLAACSAYSAARLLNIGRSDNDLNGDGYADLAVSDQISLGHVYVYLGPALAASGVRTITGVQAEETFGAQIAVGDWNGDGFSDLAIGAPWHDGDFTDGGQVRVYFGGATFDTTADRIINGAATGVLLGNKVGNLGDVNGDGFDDLGVGAPESDNSDGTTGRSDIFFGGAGDAFDTTADATLTTPVSATFSFGHGVTGADLNCDGYSDVVENGATGVVYYGRSGTIFDTTPDVTLGPAGSTGYVVASAGDVNSDGCADLIRSDYTTNALDKSARVVLGNATDSFASIELIPPTSTDTSTNFGGAVTGAGDINNDGFADVVVGASGDTGGKAHVYFGGTTMNHSSDATFSGTGEGNTGFAVAGGSDVNGDGIADIAITAYLAETSTLADAGQVFVLYGGATFNTTADKTLDGFATYAYFGWAMGF